jgi:hypothetical protein
MLNEDYDDRLMSDIHYMTEQGWTEMLEHLTEMHQMRDEFMFKALFDRVDLIQGQSEIYYGLWEMNYGVG